jgi:hypothetical protein
MDASTLAPGRSVAKRPEGAAEEGDEDGHQHGRNHKPSDEVSEDQSGGDDDDCQEPCRDAHQHRSDPTDHVSPRGRRSSRRVSPTGDDQLEASHVHIIVLL